MAADKNTSRFSIKIFVYLTTVKFEAKIPRTYLHSVDIVELGPTGGITGPF